MVQDHIWKNIFITLFSPIFAPKTAPFQGTLRAPKRVTMGANLAKNICLGIPNGPGSLLEEPIFHTFLTPFWSQNGPFSSHFGIFHGPKRVTAASKWAKTTCLSIPNAPRSLCKKHDFDPFSVPQRPIFQAFWDFSWAKTRDLELKMG